MRSKQPSAMQIKQVVSPERYYKSKGIDCQRGSAWVSGGLCPFHDDKRAGSFFVNLDSGAFNCFSCNQAGRDIIAFEMRLNDYDFRSAMIVLASDLEVNHA